VAEAPEIVERHHFQFEERRARREFPADGVESGNTGQFLDAFRQKFLGLRGSFLRRRLISGLVGVYGTLLVAANVKQRSRLRSIDNDG